MNKYYQIIFTLVTISSSVHAMLSQNPVDIETGLPPLEISDTVQNGISDAEIAWQQAYPDEIGLSKVDNRSLKRIQIIDNIPDIASSPQKYIGYDSEQKKSVCTFCKKLFDAKKDCLQHIKRHAKKKFQCTECTLKYGTQRGLDRHKYLKHSITKHICLHCNKKFASEAKLNKHKSQKHGIEKHAY